MSVDEEVGPIVDSIAIWIRRRRRGGESGGESGDD